MLHETFKNRQDRQNATKIILARQPQILRNLKNVLYVCFSTPAYAGSIQGAWEYSRSVESRWHNNLVKCSRPHLKGFIFREKSKIQGDLPHKQALIIEGPFKSAAPEPSKSRYFSIFDRPNTETTTALHHV